jgi:hypothetical protein
MDDHMVVACGVQSLEGGGAGGQIEGHLFALLPVLLRLVQLRLDRHQRKGGAVVIVVVSVTR